MGGCDASIRATPPAMSQFVTSGTDPFIGIYSAVEGGTHPLISEVAFEVATKLTSAVLSKLSVARWACVTQLDIKAHFQPAISENIIVKLQLQNFFQRKICVGQSHFTKFSFCGKFF